MQHLRIKEDTIRHQELGIEHHAKWVERFIGKYEFREDNIDEILYHENGKTFEEILEDCGVYKCTPEGLISFDRFIDYINKN